MAELKYWIWLSEKRSVPLKYTYELINYFGSPEQIYFARENELRFFGFDTSPFLDKGMAGVNRILRCCEALNIDIMTYGDSKYPARLMEIYDPPLVLYTKGRLPLLDEEAAIAVVGTRRCSNYGVLMSEQMAYDITRAGGLIITGLARGIDSAAARGALRAGGKVVGVLGNGIDVVYPSSSAWLYADVICNGCLVSEYPPGTPPEGRNFPPRNRIMSGLSVGVLVVEAPERSGALITAARALEQGRDVFVVPANADSENSVGSNELLRDGATPVLRGSDVTDEYLSKFPEKLTTPEYTRRLDGEGRRKLLEKEGNKEPEKAEKVEIEEKKQVDNPPAEDYIEISVKPEELSPEEKTVLSAITEPKMLADDIINGCALNAGDVLAALTMLEITGCVTRFPGNRYTANLKLSEAK